MQKRNQQIGAIEFLGTLRIRYAEMLLKRSYLVTPLLANLLLSNLHKDQPLSEDFSLIQIFWLTSSAPGH